MESILSVDKPSATNAAAEDDANVETDGDPLGLSQQRIKSTKVGRCANTPKLNGHTSQDLKGNMQSVQSGTNDHEICGSSSNE